MAARCAEGQRTHEVCRPPQWVSDSLTVWVWVQQVVLFWPCIQIVCIKCVFAYLVNTNLDYTHMSTKSVHIVCT